jgi:hypothetical protein
MLGMEQPVPTPPPRSDATGPSGGDRVAETMRRVQAQLRGGHAPSFEALLALGEPTRG